MKSIQSVEKAITILDCISTNNGELGLTEIGKKLGLPITTLYGFIHTLEKCHMIRKESSTGKYILGEHVLQYAMSCPKENLLMEIVHPFLIKIRDAVNETVHLGIRYNETQVIYIDKVESTNPLRMTSVVGLLDEMDNSAIGNMILWSTSKNKSDRVFDNIIKIGDNVCSIKYEDSMDAYCLVVPIQSAAEYFLPAAISIIIPGNKLTEELKLKAFDAAFSAVKEIDRILAQSKIE